MSYEPTTWLNGDTITAQKLNKMEQGISAAGEGYDLVIASVVGVSTGQQNVNNWHVVSGSYEACEAKQEAGEPVNALAIVWEQQWSTDPPNDLKYYLPLVHYHAPYGLMRFGAILNDNLAASSISTLPAFVYVTIKYNPSTYELQHVQYARTRLAVTT